MAPIGVVPWRMSTAAGEPPQISGEPGDASWWITTPLRFSAHCWRTASRRVTGEVAPAIGIETSSAGIPERAQSTSAWQVRSLHFKGGLGQQSKMARGRRLSSASPPRTARSISRMGAKPSFRNVPVTTGFTAFPRIR